MTLPFPRLLNRFKGMQANPIVVKELRQAVRSKFVVGVLLIYVAFLVLVSGIFLATTSVSVYMGNDSDASGQLLFMWFGGILAFGCILFIPLYCGIRLAKERSGANMDLLYITTISSSAIIRGKLLAGVVIAILLFSVTLPFMTLSYLLRGIDIPSMGMGVAMVFIYVVGAIQFGILVACVPASRIFKVLLGIVAVCILIMTAWFAIASILGISMMGMGSMLGTWEFWGPVLVGLTVTLCALSALHVFSIALLMPPTSNRALLVRSFVTVVWLVATGAILAWSFIENEDGALAMWVIMTIPLLMICMLIAMSEKDELSMRVRKTIPRFLPARRFAFLFYNGPVGGMLWTLMLASLTVLLLPIGTILKSASGHSYGPDFWDIYAVGSGLLILVYCYGMTSLLLHRILLKKWIPTYAIWVMALSGIAFGAVLPGYFKLARGFHNAASLQGYWFGSVVGMFDEEYRPLYILFAVVWAAIITLVNWRWAYRNMKNFKPLPKPAKPVESQVSVLEPEPAPAPIALERAEEGPDPELPTGSTG